MLKYSIVILDKEKGGKIVSKILTDCCSFCLSLPLIILVCRELFLKTARFFWLFSVLRKPELLSISQPQQFAAAERWASG